MKLTKLAIHNFEGLESLEMTPADLTIIEGHNGAGKTSVLDAIRVAFTNKGERSLLVRDGATQGLILFELSDGSIGERQVQDGGRTAGPLTMQYGNGRSINAAQKFLDRLGLGFGFNPLAFIELSPAEQSKRLLEVTHLDVPLPQLLALGGGNLSGVRYTDHPLLVLKAIETALEEQRREVGRAARDTEGMVERLRAEVPADFNQAAAQDFDLGMAVAELQQIHTAQRDLQRLAAEQQSRESRIAGLLAEVRRLEQEGLQAEIACQNIEQLLATLSDASQLEAQMAAYKQNQHYLSRLTEATQREQEASDLRRNYALLTERLTAVRAKPAELLAAQPLPVAGLGLTEGQVTINGLPIGALSTGEQLDVAVDIAIATLGELQVVLVDGLERLDNEHQTRMLARLLEAGVQAFVTRVTDTELTILTPDALDTVDTENTHDRDEIPF